MRKGSKRFPAAVLTIVLLVICFQAAGRGESSLSSRPILNAAFSLLEPGNPFMIRYNQATGESVEARMPLGVPFLWGGRTASHVFAKQPDYVVQAAWQNSPAYYRAGLKYLYGFDCYGFVAWAWEEACGMPMARTDELLQDYDRHIRSSDGRKMPALGRMHRILIPGDLLMIEHPGRHIAIYIGTLRMYGYTAEEVPELAAFLDDPLVIHATVNAQIADRFADLIQNGLPKYSVATVTDGGVCVSLVSADSRTAPHTVRQQNQDTRYYELPDGTWLTVLGWQEVTRYCWYRTPEDI